MANIIIPPQHQSAPKQTPYPDWADDLECGPMPPKTYKPDTFDTEMDLPQYNDPKILAEIEELKKNVMSVSPSETVESALREYEKNYQKVNAYRWKGQERWQGRENEEMRLLNFMHPHTFIYKLQKAGIEASLDFGRTHHARIWLNDFVRVGRVGVNAWRPSADESQLVPTTITTLQYPYGPEWTLMRFDAYNLPTNERFRGWRTALLTLIVAGVLSEEEAHRAFGAPRLGVVSDFYRQQLYDHRAFRYGLRIQ